MGMLWQQFYVNWLDCWDSRSNLSGKIYIPSLTCAITVFNSWHLPRGFGEFIACWQLGCGDPNNETGRGKVNQFKLVMLGSEETHWRRKDRRQWKRPNRSTRNSKRSTLPKMPFAN